MSDPIIAAKEPFSVEVQAGKKYFWCSCGKSSKQPFCDGSHSGTGFVPEMYEADKDRTVFFCGCKHSARKPLCDGSHSKL